MICPNCAAEQPESFECVRCGVIFAKWAEHQAQVRAHDARANVSVLTEPIGTTSRVIRTIAGVVLVALAFLMYLDGAATKAFGAYVALVFFAAAGLYLVVSLRDRIPFWRFAVEGAATLVMSASLFVALPDIFSLGRPLYESTAVPASGEAAAFVEASRTHLDAMSKFMEIKEFKDTDEAVAAARGLSEDALARLWSTIPERDRDIVAPIWYRLQGLKPLLAALVKQFPAELPKGPAMWVPAAIASEFRSNVARVQAEIEAADGRLRARDQAVVTGVAPTH
ncbi:MAG: hypothetical protein FJ087_10910 [Deltaproteobacteria bacterium]|nr:hypothetical protein [Deltaproteobacteria bacterium]